MDEPELSHLFRDLERRADPDPAFADALFERLEAEVAAPAGRGRSAAWLLVAAAVVVAGLVGGAVALGGGLRLPILVANPSPTASATPSAVPNPSSSVLPSSAPSVAPSHGPVVMAPEGVLPLGAVVVLDRDLPLRSYPSSDAPVRLIIPSGTRLMVANDPLRLAGDLWFGLQPVDDARYSTASGWAPLHPSDGRIAVDPVTCPDGELDIAALAGMTSWQRLACYGSRELTFEAWLAESPGGGTPIATYDPDWLANPFGFVGLIGPESGSSLLPVHAPADANPIAGLPIIECVTTPCGLHVLVTGHFDDPAAAACTVTGMEITAELRADVDAAHAVVSCREAFVVTSAAAVP